MTVICRHDDGVAFIPVDLEHLARHMSSLHGVNIIISTRLADPVLPESSAPIES